MREVTITYELYTFSELSEEAKEKAKRWYLQGQESRIFTDSCLEKLGELFPCSSLNVEYSLSHCQGDGFNIYGEASVEDLLAYIKHNGDSFSEKEIEILRSYGFESIEIPSNPCGYSYCVAGTVNFAEEWIELLEYDDSVDADIQLIQRFEGYVQETFTHFSKEFEASGYEYFYEISDEVMAAECEANDYEFLKDGTFFS